MIEARGRQGQRTKSEQRTEAEEQATVIEFCELLHIPAVHIPNEGKRTLSSGRALVAMGLRKGFPDMFIPAARNGFHGLFIELKRDVKSRVSEEQRNWLAYLNAQGYRAVVCYGADEAIEEIRGYMGR